MRELCDKARVCLIFVPNDCLLPLVGEIAIIPLNRVVAYIPQLHVHICSYIFINTYMYY